MSTQTDEVVIDEVPVRKTWAEYKAEEWGVTPEEWQRVWDATSWIGVPCGNSGCMAPIGQRCPVADGCHASRWAAYHTFVAGIVLGRRDGRKRALAEVRLAVGAMS